MKVRGERRNERNASTLDADARTVKGALKTKKGTCESETRDALTETPSIDRSVMRSSAVNLNVPKTAQHSSTAYTYLHFTPLEGKSAALGVPYLEMLV